MTAPLQPEHPQAPTPLQRGGGERAQDSASTKEVLKTSPAPAWAQLKEGQKPKERGVGGQRRRRAIYGVNTALVCGRKIFSLNKQDSQPRFPEALLSVHSSASKKKEKTSRARDRGERKTALQPTLQGLRGLCRGWQAGGSGQGWGAQLPPPPWAQGLV